MHTAPPATAATTLRRRRTAQLTRLPARLLHGRPSVPGVTIDPKNAGDHDDAIWVTRAPDGAYQALVHITEVAALVAKDSAADCEAYRRAATRYYETGADPMLAAYVANDAASLLPGLARLTFTHTLRFAPDAALLQHDWTRTQLASSHKLTYNEADWILGQPDHALHDMLTAAHDLATLLLARRRAAGALAVWDSVKRWRTTEEGFLLPIPEERLYQSNLIIQELMIAANSATAARCAREGIPILFRNHKARPAAPNHDDLLADIARAIALDQPGQLASLQDRLLLVLERATYGALLEGHWALCLPSYAHTTSPIRRFADLITQRQLIAYLQGAPFPYSLDALAAIAEHLTTLEHARKDAAREARRARPLPVAPKDLPDALAAVSTLSLTRILKRAIHLGDPDAALAAEITSRAEAQRLTAADLVLILFEAPDTPAWHALREPLLASLPSQPSLVKNTTAMLLRGLGCRDAKLVAVPHSEQPGQFQANLTLTFGARTLRLAGTAGTPAEARQTTRLALLRELAYDRPNGPVTAWNAQPPASTHLADALHRHAAGQEPTDEQLLTLEATLVAPTVPPLLLYQVLLETPAGAAWQRLRAATLAHLARDPSLAATVATLAAGRGDVWASLTRQDAATGQAHRPAFTCTVTIHDQGTVYRGQAAAGSKGRAYQQALLDLFARYHDLPLLTPSGTPKPAGTSGPQAAAAPAPRPSVPPKTLLNEICTRRRWPPPVYSMTISGPPHASTFDATVRLQTPGCPYEATGSASSRRQAETAAAAALLQLLPASQQPDATPPSGDAPSPASAWHGENAKGRLQELCQAHRWALPTYVSMRNTSDPDRFDAHVTLLTPTQTHRASATAACTIRQAEHQAAHALLRDLETQPTGAQTPA